MPTEVDLAAEPKYIPPFPFDDVEKVSRLARLAGAHEGIRKALADFASKCRAIRRNPDYHPEAAERDVLRQRQAIANEILSRVSKIADGETFKIPATIDDPAILDEIRAAVTTLGYGQE